MTDLRVASPACRVVFLLATLVAQGHGQARESRLPYQSMAARIVAALKPSAGERAILRYDPATMPRLAEELQGALERRQVDVALLSYEEVDDLAARLDRSDVYVWLPYGTSPSSPAEAAALVEWLDGGRGRQIHFHWGSGTMGRDGVAGEHSEAYDRIYASALDIDYAALERRQAAAVAALRSGTVTVTTIGGTRLRFRVGDRPFNRQNGDASVERMRSARTRIDREIELPAGVIRVAPVEETVDGVIVIPQARFGGTTVRDLRLEFRNGRITQASASAGAEAFRAAVAEAPALEQFREFGLGFNPKLVAPRGSPWLPYYGYGAGIVRLSLGDNSELGGAVRGGAVRWFFFADATVVVDRTVVVEDGRLVDLSVPRE